MDTLRQKNVIFIHIPKTAGSSIRSSLKDLPLKPRNAGIDRHFKALAIRSRVDLELFNSSFKFAFVRNPWDRQVSLYHYILKTSIHPTHEKTKLLGCFKTFVFSRAKLRFSQYSWISDKEGNLLVDFVGRFENLEADFQTLCTKIGISTKLEHVNATDHLHYQHYYDDETRDLTARMHSEDIERFGYTF